MTTPEGQRRQWRSAVTCNNTLLLLGGVSFWVSSYFLKQSGPHIHKKLVILYIITLLHQLWRVCVCVWAVCCVFSSAAFGFFLKGLHLLSRTVPTGFSYVNPSECRWGGFQVQFIVGGAVKLKALLHWRGVHKTPHHHARAYGVSNGIMLNCIEPNWPGQCWQSCLTSLSNILHLENQRQRTCICVHQM